MIVEMATKEGNRDPLEVIFINRALIPSNTFDRDYLRSFHAARKAWVETGNMNFIHNFTALFDEIDPEINNRLKRQVDIIISTTPKEVALDPVKTEAALIIHSEVKSGEAR